MKLSIGLITQARLRIAGRAGFAGVRKAQFCVARGGSAFTDGPGTATIQSQDPAHTVTAKQLEAIDPPVCIKSRRERNRGRFEQEEKQSVAALVNDSILIGRAVKRTPPYRKIRRRLKAENMETDQVLV
jgi:hypothetical protein